MSLADVGTVARLRRLLQSRRPLGTVALVPTMGALHAGHAALIERARAESKTVVVSLFVNPLQFGPGEDFERYPRTLEKDREFCVGLGVDILFAPPTDEIYRDRTLTRVAVSGLDRHLCGAGRPGHFEGVATIVAKLLNIVQPDIAYFGEKDAQQLAIVRRMVRDLDFPVEVRPVPTVREADGLAVSSRNRNLDAAQRRQAPQLYRALLEADRRLREGETTATTLERVAREKLSRAEGIEIEYLAVVDAETLEPVAVVEWPVLIAAAVRIGPTRLIDNLRLTPPSAATAVRS